MEMVLGALAFFFAFAGQDPAAGDVAVDFRWDAPAQGCPEAGFVRGEIERLLGRPLGADGEGRSAMTAIARVREEEGAWDLRLWTVRDGRTHFRVVTAESCELVAQAGALITAMAIDPDALTRGSQEATEVAEAAEASAQEVEAPPEKPEAEAEVEVETESEPEPKAGVEAPPAPTPRPATPIRLYALGGVNYGSMPALGAMAELGAAAHRCGEALGEVEPIAAVKAERGAV